MARITTKGLSLITPLSNLHTLLTGIALYSRLSVAEVALLLRDSLQLLDSAYNPKEDKLFPFFMQADIQETCNNKDGNNGREAGSGGVIVRSVRLASSCLGSLRHG